MNPWPAARVAVHEVGRPEPVPVKVDESNGECLVFPTLAGRKYFIEPKKKPIL